MKRWLRKRRKIFIVVLGYRIIGMALFIGLMSGTSMDGVDAALVELDNNQCITGITRPYGVEARRFLDDVLHANAIDLGTLHQLNTVLGREFGLAVLELLEKANCSAHDVVAIGSHGQTICHDTTAAIPYTVQLACPHTIVEMTGICVVADFRTRDLVVGGQGAPFAPMYHQVLFAHQKTPLMLVNIGGIANVTFLQESQPPRGYDVGPGNCLMDAWIQLKLNQPYDAGGAWAHTGRVIPSLLSELSSDPFFQQKPPKSIGKEYFSLSWLEPKLQKDYAPEDIQATLLELTAMMICNALDQIAERPTDIVICGGGVHNTSLIHALKRHSKEVQVVSSTQFGVDPDFIEAMMFAWLAEKTIHKVPLDLSALTGSKKPVILGAVYHV